MWGNWKHSGTMTQFFSGNYFLFLFSILSSHEANTGGGDANIRVKNIVLTF